MPPDAHGLQQMVSGVGGSKERRACLKVEIAKLAVAWQARASRIAKDTQLTFKMYPRVEFASETATWKSEKRERERDGGEKGFYMREMEMIDMERYGDIDMESDGWKGERGETGHAQPLVVIPVVRPQQNVTNRNGQLVVVSALPDATKATI